MKISLKAPAAFLFYFLVSLTSQAQSPQKNFFSVPPKGLSFGAAFNGNINFSDQSRGTSNQIEQKNRYFFPAVELLAAYTWPTGWRAEAGVGVGSVATVALDASEEFGRGSTLSVGTVQVPLRLYRHFALGSSRFTVSPGVGVQYVALSTGEKTVPRQPIFSGKPEFGSMGQTFTTLRDDAFTYQVGAGLNYIAPKLELNFFVRYTNGIGRPLVLRGMMEYDREGVEQPAIVSHNHLESVTIGVAVRRTFFAH